MIERDNKITLDIDKERIREIVEESLRIIKEYSGGILLVPEERVLEKLNKLLDANAISTEFYLLIPLDKIPDLRLRVNPRRRKLLCKSSFKKKVAKLNRFIKIL
jgi:hypothetical protein